MCQSDGALCINGYWDQYGEFVYAYSNGIVDYIARSVDTTAMPAVPVGVIRNVPGAGGTLRCFSTPGEPCAAPPNSSDFPEQVPEIFDTNVVPWATEQQAENAAGSAAGAGTPKTTIVGEVAANGWQTFEWINMDNSCNQTPAGPVSNLVSFVYVTGIYFGGDMASTDPHDALVIDEQERNGSNPDHIERYFYVNGWGRVREASAHYDANTGNFDLFESGNSARNTYAKNITNPPAISPAPNYCPQGSASW